MLFGPMESRKERVEGEDDEAVLRCENGRGEAVGVVFVLLLSMLEMELLGLCAGPPGRRCQGSEGDEGSGELLLMCDGGMAGPLRERIRSCGGCEQ